MLVTKQPLNSIQIYIFLYTMEVNGYRQLLYLFINLFYQTS